MKFVTWGRVIRKDKCLVFLCLEFSNHQDLGKEKRERVEDSRRSGSVS